jgi:single-stranded-DNA-specific exonuclease
MGTVFSRAQFSRNFYPQTPIDDESQQLDGIYFNIDIDQWPTSITTVHCVYRLDINEFRGRETLQLLIQYMAPVSKS